jgi:hypothetical protein
VRTYSYRPEGVQVPILGDPEDGDGVFRTLDASESHVLNVFAPGAQVGDVVTATLGRPPRDLSGDPAPLLLYGQVHTVDFAQLVITNVTAGDVRIFNGTALNFSVKSL